ncbi:carbon-nitrogen hydrolase family protein [Alicyclobacillus vulcanalis]|uniref:5-aminopentanamidase n=1 Tax=Alicyclobacillus vulcanalis TaxID=252246 RepID=A0A1N7L2X9_9BACL|nr:carbon-nitrogen hydrolase family protein [Alicyclobacillus vulcanalis]SIS68106.1 5-aminopentanamidase [Alicyclobacillus vulcanalis]
MRGISDTSDPAPIRVALAQLAVADGDVERNLTKIATALEQASRQGADVLLTPELSLTGLVSGEVRERLAEPPNGGMQQALSELARCYGVATVFSYPEKGAGGEISIATRLVSGDGACIHVYHKMHLFAEEKHAYAPGDALSAFSWRNWTAGILTCYDLEFPEPARRLAVQGCRLLFVNAANMEPYETIHRTFLLARAMENQMFVVYCNRVGRNARYRYRGMSGVAAPDGTVLLDLGLDEEAVQCVDLDWSLVLRSRSAYDYLADRRLSE